MIDGRPRLSVSIPTFNNVDVLRTCIESWREMAGALPVEVIVVEDGCSDGTPAFLDEACATEWGRRRLRWVHEDNVHELRATNRGLAEARGDVLLAWQDDMFLRARWLVPELLATFDAYADVGLVSLSRGLTCTPCADPIERWEDLTDWRRLQSTIGSGPLNWFRLQEVDIVIRPWAVRRACLERVGALDPIFVPTEWDEADLCYRIREAGWKIATYGYERALAYHHLGSTTISKGFSEAYKQRVLRNGLVFHERWDTIIARDAPRRRVTWWRRSTPAGWTATAVRAAGALARRLGGARS
ncbi:MAG TPA: glycosyltransferase [Vicinamibacterales bacterium]|nr:glycosyltransferase [Vicinamibacterales bacterium]